MTDADPTPELPASPPEAWDFAERAARAIASPLQRVLAIEAASGILLLACTIVALVLANSGWHDAFHALWEIPIGARVGDWAFERPLHFWINDGLMTVFFFVVGLEIRREIFEGELATVRKAALPIAAAIGGMLIPAAIFVALNYGRDGARGWAVPMATDIAFAVGVLTLLGSRVPNSWRVLLLALAVIDDVGAIIVIAIFYSSDIAPMGFVIAAGAIAVVLVMRLAAVRSTFAYLLPGVVLWAGLYHAGIHPTLAGVALGLLTPVRSWFGPSGFAATTQTHLQDMADKDTSQLFARLAAINQARREAVSPAERLIHVLHPFVAYGVMPLFALANAGVALGGADLGGDGWWLFLGIVLGLAIGKPLGIVGATLAASRSGYVERSSELRIVGLTLVGVVGGIGFTMSLFIAQLAFPAGALLETAKLAILVGSATAIVLGLVFGVLATRTIARPD